MHVTLHAFMPRTSFGTQLWADDCGGSRSTIPRIVISYSMWLFQLLQNPLSTDYLPLLPLYSPTCHCASPRQCLERTFRSVMIVRPSQDIHM